MSLNFIEQLKDRTKTIHSLKEQKHFNLSKKIAVLSDASTQELKSWLEYFCLLKGIEVEFFDDDFSRLYEDSVFANEKLELFTPNLIIVIPSSRKYTSQIFTSNIDEVDSLVSQGKDKILSIVQGLSKYNCPIILANFACKKNRVLGNLDAISPLGLNNQIKRLNLFIDDLVYKEKLCYLCDLNYLSSSIGLDVWEDNNQYYLFRYDMSQKALMNIGLELSKICNSIFGLSKKVLVCDLDNTLWGGVIGEDGVDGIKIGNSNIQSEVFSDIQRYIKSLKERGVILCIASKNDLDEVKLGFSNENMILKLSDFSSIKANWNTKSSNIQEMAEELSLGLDSFVFLDDNPTEREEIKQALPLVHVLDVTAPSSYIDILDSSGLFESISITKDDIQRSQMYKERADRIQYQKSFYNYDDYLKSLDMETSIERISINDIERCTQLINKTNQFNLTTIRYTKEELISFISDAKYLCILVRSKDKFGDNGIVSVVICEISDCKLNINLWLMSCRVLKKDIEFDVLDAIVKFTRDHGIKQIIGTYIPTSKNNLVKSLYLDFGFQPTTKNIYLLDVDSYITKNKQISKITLKI